MSKLREDTAQVEEEKVQTIFVVDDDLRAGAGEKPGEEVIEVKGLEIIPSRREALVELPLGGA